MPCCSTPKVPLTVTLPVAALALKLLICSPASLPTTSALISERFTPRAKSRRLPPDSVIPPPTLGAVELPVTVASRAKAPGGAHAPRLEQRIH